MTKKRFKRIYISQRIAPYIFILPFFIAFLLFQAFPILFSFFLSFQKWNGMQPFTFNGIKNYITIFNDRNFWWSFFFNIQILIYTIIPLHILAILFAVMLNSALIKLKTLFKTLFFLPYITSAAVIAIVFWLLYANNGLINILLQKYFSWLFNFLKINLPLDFYGYNPYQNIFHLSLSFLLIWKFLGWNIILYFTALQGIPKSYYEAAKVDGANWFQTLTKITLPLIKPMMYFAVTMSVIYILQLFDEPTILLSSNVITFYGGLTFVIYLFNQAFTHMNFGVAAAVAYILFFIILAITKLLKFILREK